MVQPFVSNIISNKYDTALDFHITMYDELPYERDSDFCGREQIAMHSNSLLKYYLYMFEDISKIDNGDDQMEAYLSELVMRNANQAKIAQKSVKDTSADDHGVTEEQIQTLLDDNEGEADVAPPQSENSDPFADVEDW